MRRAASFPVRCGAAVLSGIAYALAFLPIGWSWLVVLGIVGFLWSSQGYRGSRARGIGFLFGMASFAAGTPWLWGIFGAPAIGLWMILALFPAAFAWMQGRAEERDTAGWRWVLFTVANWCAWEFIRAELFPLRFPWMTPGLAMGPNDLLPMIGVYGVSAVVMLAAVLLTGRRWWIGVLIVALCFVARRGRPGTLERHEGTILVGAVQMENATMERYAKLTRTLPADTMHVCWPEYALPYDVRGRKQDMAALQALCAARKMVLTVGTQTTRREPPAGWHNTALTVDVAGVLGEHYKMKSMHFFDDGIPGTTALPVATPHGKIGTPICFDCDYEGPVRRMTAAGAEAFIVPSMDPASWGRLQHDQHAELFRIRACENARWMLVCSSSGVSQCIDAWGGVISRKGAMEEGVVEGLLQRETRLTIYTRWGWLTPWCLTGLAVVWWIVLLLPRRAAKDVAS
jgi:apolipoprotein N-acyltransferase